MQVKVIATDYGKHSDSRLAVAVAEHIVQVGANSSGKVVDDAHRLRSAITEVMEVQFRRLADAEHAEIDAKGTAALARELAPHPEIVADAALQVCGLIVASPFAGWFSVETTEDMCRKVVGEYVQIAQHMHRDWFARHGKVGHGGDLSDHPAHAPDCPYVRRWKALHDDGTPEAQHEFAMVQRDQAASPGIGGLLGAVQMTPGTAGGIYGEGA